MNISPGRKNPGFKTEYTYKDDLIVKIVDRYGKRHCRTTEYTCNNDEMLTGLVYRNKKGEISETYTMEYPLN